MKINKIKLVKVPRVEKNWPSLWMKSIYIPPLALANITSYLRQKGFEVNQDDLNQQVHYNNFYSKRKVNLKLLSNRAKIIRFLRGKKDKKIKKLLDRMIRLTNFDNFDIYLISLDSARSKDNIMSALLLCNYIKKVYNKTIVLGGYLNQDILDINSKLKLFDYAITGPGEIAIHRLINNLNSNKSLNNIKGLVYWKNNKIIENGGKYRPILIKPDFKGLPLHKYTFQIPRWMQKYIKSSNKKQKILILPLRFVSGCPNNCANCPFKKSLIFLKPLKVVQMLKELKETYKTNYFMFYSDTLNFSKEYINQLCDEMIKSKLGIYWSDSFRADNLDRKILIKLRKAGCIRTVFGLDSASPRILKYANRNLNLKKFSQTIKEAESIGIWVHLNTIGGYPHEKEKDINKTLTFLTAHKDYFNYLSVYHFFLSGDSMMFCFPEEYGIKNIKKIYIPTGTYLGYSKVDREINYSFDEVGGLKWKDKLKQISYSVSRILYVHNPAPMFIEDEPVLFYLYSNIQNKKEIKKLKEEITKKFCRIHVYKHPVISIKKMIMPLIIKNIVDRIKKIV